MSNQESQDKKKDYPIRHIHKNYLIGILVGVVILISTRSLAGSQELSSLLSFGLSLTSLILGLIAIFQALISSGQFDRVVDRISKATSGTNSAAEEVKLAANRVKDATELLQEKIISLSTDVGYIRDVVGTIPPENKGVAELTENSQSIDPKKDVLGVTSDDQNVVDYRANILASGSSGLILALYGLCKAENADRSFNIDTFFRNPDHRNHVMGSLSALQALGLIVFRKHDYVYDKLKMMKLSDTDGVVTRTLDSILNNEDENRRRTQFLYAAKRSIDNNYNI